MEGTHFVTNHRLFKRTLYVSIVCEPNDMHYSATTMFVACEMVGINQIQK